MRDHLLYAKWVRGNPRVFVMNRNLWIANKWYVYNSQTVAHTYYWIQAHFVHFAHQVSSSDAARPARKHHTAEWEADRKIQFTLIYLKCVVLDILYTNKSKLLWCFQCIYNTVQQQTSCPVKQVSDHHSEFLRPTIWAASVGIVCRTMWLPSGPPDWTIETQLDFPAPRLL